MQNSKILYLSRQDVENVFLSMQEIIDALEVMFRAKGRGEVEMPPKPGIHTRHDAFIHAMPGYIPSLNAAGMKWISGYPDNPKKGLPYITGLLILNDPDTGVPLAVMDAAWITAQRTGAATAVSAKYLARKDSSSVGIFACGVQGRSNLEALSCIFNISKVKAYDLNPQVAKIFAKEMGELLDLDIEVVADPKETAVGLDIVVTSGPLLKVPEPIFQPGWLAEGAFASLVDLDSYWHGDALKEADKISTDDKAQMEHFRKIGYFKNTPLPYADLGEIVTGQKPGRETDRQRTMAVNIGLGLSDVATGVILYERAKKQGIGRLLPL